MMKKIAVGILVFLLMFIAVCPATAGGTEVLVGDMVLVVGDSIAAGFRDTGYDHRDMSGGGGWGLRLAREYTMALTSAAVSGSSLTVIDNRNHIIDQLHAKQGQLFDYVLLQGGFNDCMGENVKGTSNFMAIPKLGKVSSSFDVKDFDTTTFSGSFEELLYYATTYFPNAKIGFIVTYKTPQSEYGGITDGTKLSSEGYSQADYIKRQMDLCDKWNVPYLNLWSGTAPDGKVYSGDVLNVMGEEHFPGKRDSDHIHLNAAGYDVITPYIAEWMTTLPVYCAAETTTKETTVAQSTKTNATKTANTKVTTSAVNSSDAAITTSADASAENVSTAPVEKSMMPLAFGIIAGAVVLVAGAVTAVALVLRKKP